MLGKFVNKMERLNTSFFLLSGIIIISLSQCITPFDPEISESADLINIDGSIVKGREVQKVVVSRSTSLQEKAFIPVKNCEVYVTDNAGNRFDFSASKNGIYTTRIDEVFLETGNFYQLHVITESGDIYESDFDTISVNPPVENLHFVSETKHPLNSTNEIKSLQLYIDLKESEGASRYYRWIIDETWEHHAKYPISLFYVRGEETTSAFPDSLYWSGLYTNIYYYCYDSSTTTGLYLSNTLYLEKNEYKRIPLQFVNRGSIKISKKYSCLINQYSLTEDAYNYWNQKKIDLLESGGMYSKQPAQAISNIHNRHNPDEIVLGYFWASEIAKRRFFYEGSYLPYFIDTCRLDSFKIEDYPFNDPTTAYDPYYRDTIFIIEEYKDYYTTNNAGCFDCREQGGTTKKPGYWPN